MKPEDIEELIGALSDLEVDVVSKNGESVRVFVE
jgi:phenylpyruvate tautomerase PptA (4-oxalocrotonate tautomerase family)